MKMLWLIGFATGTATLAVGCGASPDPAPAGDGTETPATPSASPAPATPTDTADGGAGDPAAPAADDSSEEPEVAPDDMIARGVSDEEPGLAQTAAPVPSSCDRGALQVCLDYGGGDACYAKAGCPATERVCAARQLQICLESKGGDACYAKHDCQKGVDTPTSDRGATFSRYYAGNYPAIRTAARKFWPNSFGCAAYASTALKMGGFGLKQVLLTNDVESQLKAKGWKTVTNLGALRAGDVVFTDKATSNVAGTYSHVYVFHKYASPGYAIISDNNGNNISRNIGPGPRSRSVVAYRAP